jgi:hypothetical protein
MGNLQQTPKEQVFAQIDLTTLKISQEEINYVINQCLKLKTPVANIPAIVYAYEITSRAPQLLGILDECFDHSGSTKEDNFMWAIESYNRCEQIRI